MATTVLTALNAILGDLRSIQGKLCRGRGGRFTGSGRLQVRDEVF